MRFDQAVLFVEDLQRMTDFYAELFGSQPAARFDNWVAFETGGARLVLHAIPPELTENAQASGAAAREEAACKLVFSVADIDAELTRLTGLGATILQRPWGGWDASDPEGNVFGIRQETS